MKFWKFLFNFFVFLFSLLMFIMIFSTNVFDSIYNITSKSSIDSIASGIDDIDFDFDVLNDANLSILKSSTFKNVVLEIVGSNIRSKLEVGNDFKVNNLYIYDILDKNIDKILYESSVTLTDYDKASLVVSLKKCVLSLVEELTSFDVGVDSSYFGVNRNIFFSNYLLIMIVIIICLFLFILLFKYNVRKTVYTSGLIILINGIISLLMGIFLGIEFVYDIFFSKFSEFDFLINGIINYFSNVFVRNGFIMLFVGILLIIFSIFIKKFELKKEIKHIVGDVNVDNNKNDVVYNDLEDTMDMKTFAERVDKK